MSVVTKNLRSLFIPSSQNGNVPNLLRKSAFSIYLLLALTLIFSPFYFERSYVASLSKGLSFGAEEVIRLVNGARENEGLPALVENEMLARAAEKKAEDMIARGYFAHFAPDGTSPWSFIKNEGYRYFAAGENLAVDFVSADAAHRAFMDSPTHRANILQPLFTEIGVAVRTGWYNGHESIYIVQFFGKPKTFTAGSTSEKLPESGVTLGESEKVLPPAEPVFVPELETPPASSAVPLASETGTNEEPLPIPPETATGKADGKESAAAQNYDGIKEATDAANMEYVLISALAILSLLIAFTFHVSRSTRFPTQVMVRVLILILLFGYIAVRKPPEIRARITPAAPYDVQIGIEKLKLKSGTISKK